MAECGCCGQHVVDWNEDREREVEDSVLADILISLPGNWKKVADNAAQWDLPDGYVTVIVRPYIKES